MTFRYPTLLLLLLPAWIRAAEPATTWCNPIPLPDYPIGRLARGVTPGDPSEKRSLWLDDTKSVFRELADPSAIFQDGKWYLYPSVDMAWVSSDDGLTWTHHPLNVRDIGYAPTVVRHQGKFLLLASESEIHAADSPLGPFTPIGKIDFAGHKVPALVDPMLFSDEGRLFLYWGCTAKGGIWGVELDAASPGRIVGIPKELFPFRSKDHPWERLGDSNQNPDGAWMEGSWMIKLKDTYYLTYSAAGTQHTTYAIGCYISKSPLGPFVPQKRNPILRQTTGLVTGTGHGCVVEGPGGALRVFYCVRANVTHGFERRLGMDTATLDENGELRIHGATSTPQRLAGGDTGWLPLNHGAVTIGSTNAPNLAGRFAADLNLTTWWQPAENDKAPVLTSQLLTPSTIHAVRIAWLDVGLDPKHGVHPGPFRYRVEIETTPGKWETLIDRSESREDLLVDYRECPPKSGTNVRLVIVGAPEKITPGVAEFTVFGKAVSTP